MHELMAQLGAPEQDAEGRFFPDTYFFAAGSSDLAVLRRAHRAMTRRLGRRLGEREHRGCRSRRPTRR